MEDKEINQLVVSTHDLVGGAARSTYRLFKAFKKTSFKNLKSNMLVQYKDSSDSNIFKSESVFDKLWGKIISIKDLLPLNKYKDKVSSMWSLGWIPNNVSKQILKFNPDIVHLNWVGRGFLPIKELSKIKKPIVWTFHDMWAFTGGCHYSFECKRYTDFCGDCPQLLSKKENDISRALLKKKKRYWDKLNITIVCPSNWLAQCSKESYLFGNIKTEVIPYTIDAEVFKPVDKSEAKKILNLPQNKKIILFGGLSAIGDRRKGFQYLIPALKKLEEEFSVDDLEILIFGAQKPKDEVKSKFIFNYLGYIHDDITLSIIYSAADIFVMPSIQDNLPNTVLESMACGTPVTAFNIGGNPDMIEHKINGYLAQPFEIDDLAEGIKWVLTDAKELSLKARKKILNNYSQELITDKYTELFKKILNK